MPTVVGVRLRFSKTLWFDPAGTVPEEGETVIVATDRGVEVGTVVQPPHEVSASALPAALKPVQRLATDADLAHIAKLADSEREAMPAFRELVAHYRLDMKPIDVEYAFDGDRITFYFSADERVDFREVVKDLASRFHARIDMRQVGVRDEARAVGGVGHCGQQLCCERLGGDFQPVSIRMAKEQDLPLNPLKISGLCGRLMCCLRYEVDAYKDYKSRAPRRGAMIETPGGSAKVTDLNTPKETVTMRTGDGTTVTVPLSSMCCAKESGCPCSVSQEAFELATGKDPLAAALAARPEPTVMRELKAESKPRSRAESKAKAKDETGGKAEPKAKAEAEPSAKEGAQPSRRRRRRKSGGGGGQSSETAPKQESTPKAAGGESSAQGTGDGSQRTPRRRRRRRPGSGGDSAT